MCFIHQAPSLTCFLSFFSTALPACQTGHFPWTSSQGIKTQQLQTIFIKLKHNNTTSSCVFPTNVSILKSLKPIWISSLQPAAVCPVIAPPSSSLHISLFMLTMISMLTLYRHYAKTCKKSTYWHALGLVYIPMSHPSISGLAIGVHSSSYLFRLLPLSPKSQSRMYFFFFFPANTAKEALPF